MAREKKQSSKSSQPKEKKGNKSATKSDVLDFSMEIDIFALPAPSHIRSKKWTKKEILEELEALRLWLSDPHPLNVTFERFAVTRGYSRQRISEWAANFPKDKKIQVLYQICQDIQRNKFFVGGLTRTYSEQLSKFALINCCGMKPEMTHVIEGNPDKPIAVGAPQDVLDYLERLKEK